MISRRHFLFGFGSALAASPLLARAGGVEIGVCAKSRDFQEAVRCGFDYFEPAVAEVAAMSVDAFNGFRQLVRSSPIRCECFNSFIRQLRVVGTDVEKQEDELRRYLEDSFDRCQQLGGAIVVWGSASSRNVPAGYSRALAWQQIRSFLRLAGDFARPKGITVAIEPLRHEESNIINTGAEALKLVREVNHPNVRMIIDFYHLREENEDPEIIWKARKEIVHFHFANPRGRVWPKSPTEDPEYAKFFDLVKKIHFRGGISIEGNGSVEEDGAASLKFFREELA